MTLKHVRKYMKLSDNIRFLIVDDDQHLTKSLEEGLTLFDKNYHVKSIHFQGDLQELMDQVSLENYDNPGHSDAQN
jgi:hypothetical protein